MPCSMWRQACSPVLTATTYASWRMDKQGQVRPASNAIGSPSPHACGVGAHFRSRNQGHTSAEQGWGRRTGAIRACGCCSAVTLHARLALQHAVCLSMGMLGAPPHVRTSSHGG